MNLFKPSLGSDNHSGVHPKIMETLLATNHGHSPAYGTDPITLETEKLFKQHFGENSSAYFVFNGTAANILCLRALLKPYECVIASDCSHLQQDECGAPEFHLRTKLHILKSEDGKIRPQDAKPLLIRRGDQHYSQPKCVSLTNPTEVGTVYSMEELGAWGSFCRSEGLLLHIDGTRLPLAANYLQKTFREITLDIGADAVSFGGTKNGLLFGEACVFPRPVPEFSYLRKQSMQLPSKMRFVSAMLKTFLETGLWQEIASQEHALALFLAEKLKPFKQTKIVYPVQSNAVFLQFPKAWTTRLREQTFFYIWDETTWVARLMCSFNTQKADLEAFIEVLAQLDQSKN